VVPVLLSMGIVGGIYRGIRASRAIAGLAEDTEANPPDAKYQADFGMTKGITRRCSWMKPESLPPLFLVPRLENPVFQAGVLSLIRLRTVESICFEPPVHVLDRYAHERSYIYMPTKRCRIYCRSFPTFPFADHFSLDLSSPPQTVASSATTITHYTARGNGTTEPAIWAPVEASQGQ
jgi:hypothetical protein